MQENKAYPTTNPEYEPVATDNAAPQRNKLNPLTWSTKSKVWAAIIVAAVIVGVVVGAVEGSRKGHHPGYPDYSRLNYTLEDRYEGEAFFDNFDYYHDVDPAGGFVT